MPYDDSYKGGVVSIVQSYLNNRELFKKNNFDISIFDFQLRPEEKIKNQKINNLFYWIKQRKELSKYLNENKNSILNIHTSRSFLFLKDVFLCKMATAKYNIPTILTIHVGASETVFERIKFFRFILIWILNKYVSKVIFLSKEIKNEFLDLGLRKEKCEVLYNFHNLEKINELKVINNQKIFKILYVGAIHREKGIIELLTALNNIKELNFKVDICGKITDVSIEKVFKELVENLGKKAEIHGYVFGEKKTLLFKEADILVLPSYHEGLPLVILEALVAGCGIISTPVGATPEILNEENVEWVKVKSSDEIEASIKKLYFDSEKLIKMKSANINLSKDFSIVDHIDKLCNIYKMLF